MTDIFDTKEKVHNRGKEKVHNRGKEKVHNRGKEKVHNRGKEAIGKTLSELLKSNGLSENGAPKSVAGDAWEAWFKVKKNSRAEADLPDLGIELKATPYKTNKDGSKSAKERLVLNIINYISESDATFESSSFTKKDLLIEFGFYEYKKSSNIKPNPYDFTIDEAILFFVSKKKV